MREREREEEETETLRNALVISWCVLDIGLCQRVERNLASHPEAVAETQPLSTRSEKKKQRQSFGQRRKKKNSFYCFARQRRPPQANALKTIPPLEENRKWFYSWGVENSTTDKDQD